ncbi:PAP2-domain-containing protein [Gymnopus androsaceus JB14]|uniref:Dolichyldiphosphatase n=1 Tax=Gymnopus androsaceus JB14 TaxID=1447944 RepID=A0A6A4HG65_9AGAR|nr:PAP2-domain-containing protein [Gymnopus androsaceus JB14]
MFGSHSRTPGPQASLDLTHVLYDDNSFLSLALALVTLSPILLMAAYASLAVQTREFLVICMWAGQFANEGFNWILKRMIKQDRPDGSLGNGYGFPSSHSQYMGYFSTFLIFHLYFRHRFSSTGSPFLDQAWRILVYVAVSAWGLSVAYSRYHLQYHTPHQIFWGYGIGVVCGALCYVCSELIPRHYPNSILGNFKTFLVSNPISSWLQIRDGWAVWSDGGREDEWQRWKIEWERQREIPRSKRSQ